MTKEQAGRIYLRKPVIFMAFILAVLYILYYRLIILENYTPKVIPSPIFFERKYLLYNSKCKILDIEPFNKEVKQFFEKEDYISCSSRKPLTYIEKNYDNTEAFLFINKSLIKSYTKKKKDDIICCLSNISRNKSIKSNEPIDNLINKSPCKFFKSNTRLSNNPVVVTCRSKKKQIYKNLHQSITIKKEATEKSKNLTKPPISILIIGVDSSSRLNTMRTMPLTVKLLENHNWVNFKAYNKIGDNTFPNLMAILTGKNKSPKSAIKDCDPTKENSLDKCNFIWNDFKNVGYTTAYAEDQSVLSTFNYLRRGFVEEPVDYYFRPFVLAAEELKRKVVDGMIHCTGPESITERMLGLSKDFSMTFKDLPHFGFFWFNFAHNKLNAASRMDLVFRDFFKNLNGLVENSIVIFLSDHGIRFGDYLKTYNGYLEERLPMLYILLPKWFQDKFTKEHSNFLNNSKKLTSPYDLHMTLQHVLELTGSNYTRKQSEGCSTCKSFFEEIDTERSCEEAAIDPHWCTCSGVVDINIKNEIVTNAAITAIKNIQDKIKQMDEEDLCSTYKLDSIILSHISSNEKSGWYKNDTDILITFKTSPEAIFRVTVKFIGFKNFSVEDDISRLDLYANNSKCVDNADLKLLCYCK